MLLLPGSFLAEDGVSPAVGAPSCRLTAAWAQERCVSLGEAAAAQVWQHVLAAKAGSVEQDSRKAGVRMPEGQAVAYGKLPAYAVLLAVLMLSRVCCRPCCCDSESLWGAARYRARCLAATSAADCSRVTGARCRQQLPGEACYLKQRDACT